MSTDLPRFLTVGELLGKRKADVLESVDDASSTTLPPVSKKARTDTTPPEYLSLDRIKAWIVKAVKEAGKDAHYAKVVYWDEPAPDVVAAVKTWGKDASYLIMYQEKTRQVTDGRSGKSEAMPCFIFRIMWE